ncbi:CapA family protein [uncultured Thermanaerothrix sp.]|uniref:CapA family protein n=1 Tax=uncultured Thermanaerothrix sp. TaxID=1195149 RepID=UPI002603678D|nr:CapA family protein [uncultured Thermanaerothrix sp.]
MRILRQGWLLIGLLWLVACQIPRVPNPAAVPTATLTPFLPLPSAAPSPSPSARSTLTLWVDPALPTALRAQVSLPPGWEFTPHLESATLRLTLARAETPLGYWVYALVGRFPTLRDALSAAELRQLWQGNASTGAGLWMDADTLNTLRAVWGTPAPGAVQVVSPEQLTETLWANPEALGIVPFERLEPRLKVLMVEGQSPLHKAFDPARYPLAVPYALRGTPAAQTAFQQATQRAGLGAPLLTGNRDPNRLTMVAVTGVTAIVRATAWMLDLRGIDYAIAEIAPWLREADITHINNEVAFRENCPHTNDGLNAQGVIVFPCSDSRYLAVLEALGTDVVEMTGDHFIDARPEDVLYTLEQYHQRGWQTYGGGATLEEGYRPARFEHNGNRIAFTGCNAKGPGYAQASATRPGAVLCDFDRLTADIATLRAQGYLPIVTFSHIEYETFAANPLAVQDFRRVAQAGAVIVSGSQGHLPQAMEFYGTAFLHYGLGNLLFDQWSLGAPFDQAFIDRHIFYAGRYVSTELLTLRFVDFARSRSMTPEERHDLLQTVFSASGW